jgi:outer membrane receptor for ferrienterochelin and colicins
MKRILTILTFTLICLSNISAQTIAGFIKDSKDSIALSFASITVLGTNIGTTSNANGEFLLKLKKINETLLVASFIGYKTDTISIPDDPDQITIFLEPNSQTLDEVSIVARHDATSISSISAINVQTISSAGVQRLACCSLAECFENNATVDVGYSDAVSGAKQIQMLGLSGIYSQILVENQPSVRILSSMYGLNYIPGPWLSGIGISKGTSSVVQGYESMTGQINIDLKKPENSEKFYLEYFTNDYLKQELNLNASKKITDNLSTVFLFHGATVQMEVERNNDSFLDVPKSNLLIGSNRYFYNRENKIRSRFGFDVLYEDRLGGQKGFVSDIETNNLYGVTLDTRRIYIFENTGFSVNPDKNSSIGINANFVYHKQNSVFGLKKYDPVQKSGYFTALYNTDVLNKKNKISTGLSFIYDNLEEILNDTALYKVEKVFGGFAEYTFSSEKWSVITGIRTDYNGYYRQTYITPRLHVKFTPIENSAIRISAGRGLRSANVLPENISLLNSSRTLIFAEKFRMEDAWNAGISFTQKFFLKDERQITINTDFYHTEFKNQIIVDLEQSTSTAVFYNLGGRSYSNSFQIDLIVEPVKSFEITFAYRLNDTKTTINGELIAKPLVSKHKALLALHYSTRYERWNFSFTTQYHGVSRLPDTQENPEVYRLPEASPDYFILHTQITRKFKRMEFYVGVENLTNYKQKDPILAADDPFGEYFDSSIIYAPILGRQFNFGFRLKIK